jgi:phosphoribosylanthranilate isomerase
VTPAGAYVPRVKICGLTNLSDAEAAAGMGAWALGMIFYAGSPRQCSLEAAGAITAALRRRTELCGVFVNAHLDEVALISEEIGLTLLQFHGDEGPSYCAEAARRTGARIIKAAQVGGPGDVRDLERFHVDYHLLDARAPERPTQRGGTGVTFDWGLVAARRSKVPLILSGGLTPENVVAAVAATGPDALDSARGPQARPGHKDLGRMAALFAAVSAVAEAAPGAPIGQSAHPVAGHTPLRGAGR